MISAPLLLRVSAPKAAFGTTPPPPLRSKPSRIRCAAVAPAPPAAATATLYDVLGLRAGATVREIKAAYRRLARERHPDVAGGAAAEFVRIHDAYATLSDPDTRARYDRAAGRPRRTWETDQCW